MKMLSETAGLDRLADFRNEFRSAVGAYEQKALACSSCSTPGACCLDEHFVNVRISRLEAVAIKNAIKELADETVHEVSRRISSVIEAHGLSADADKTFACPLYDRSVGCLVHTTAKPLPCIHHACYERKGDLPPDAILDDAELSVERLNRKVYGRELPLLPLPIAVQNVLG